MGQIKANIKIENLMDVFLAQRGDLPANQIRKAELEALVDTGATLLCLPAETIKNLGLHFLETRRAMTATGPEERRIYASARLTILNRSCPLDVMELEDGVPALVGYVPLELLDLQPDMKQGTVTPRHGDEIVFDLFYVSRSLYLV